MDSKRRRSTGHHELRLKSDAFLLEASRGSKNRMKNGITSEY